MYFSLPFTVVGLERANCAECVCVRAIEITLAMEHYISSPTIYNSTGYRYVSANGTLSSQTSESSRTSISSSFYSSGYSDDEWDMDFDGSGSGTSPGSNGEEIMDSYRRRLSEESRKRLMRRLESMRYPNHHTRRMVQVADRSSIDGGVPADPNEVRTRN